MKYTILFFAMLNVCSVSAQITVSTADNPTGRPSHTFMIDSLGYGLGPADTVGFSGDIFGNYPSFQTLPYIISSKTEPHKKTIKGWSQHEQWRVKSYPMTNGKVLGFIGAAISGAIDGIVEGYEFDGRKSFERKYNVSPTGYFGSESWRLAYKNNDPDQGYKNLYSRTFGANDFYHLADDGKKIGYIGSGITIGISGGRVNTKWWHYALDFVASFSLSAASKAAGLDWIRH